mgnify:CR=1 FL=1
MTYRTWMYHPIKPARIFEDLTSEQRKKLELQGWRDSPAKVKGLTTGVDIDELEPAPEPAPVDVEDAEDVAHERFASADVNAADELDALIAEAKSLGLRANRRFAPGTLRIMIDEARAEDQANDDDQKAD